MEGGGSERRSGKADEVTKIIPRGVEGRSLLVRLGLVPFFYSPTGGLAGTARARARDDVYARCTPSRPRESRPFIGTLRPRNIVRYWIVMDRALAGGRWMLNPPVINRAEFATITTRADAERRFLFIYYREISILCEPITVNRRCMNLGGNTSG